MSHPLTIYLTQRYFSTYYWVVNYWQVHFPDKLSILNSFMATAKREPLKPTTSTKIVTK